MKVIELQKNELVKIVVDGKEIMVGRFDRSITHTTREEFITVGPENRKIVTSRDVISSLIFEGKNT